MMDQRLIDAKRFLAKKRWLSVCGFITSVFFIIDPLNFTNGHNKARFLFFVLAIISVINAAAYFKDIPEDYI